MKRIVLGMSESLKEIRRNLVSNCSELDEHLVASFLFPNCDAANHWKGEIYAFIHKMDRCKATNKYPKYKFIREALAVHEDVIDNYILLVTDEHSELRRGSMTDAQIIKAVADYHDWLAFNLSTKGQVLKSEVYDAIDKLIADKQ